jgi:Amidohydrolase
MTDDEIPGFLARLGIPGIVDAHVHFLPDRIQNAVWRWFDCVTPPWPITYRSSAGERLQILAELGVRHHTALAYAHQPGMLPFLNDHTLGLAEAVPAVIPTFTIYPEPGVAAETERCLATGGRAVKVHLQVGGFDATDPLLDGAWGLLQDAGIPIILHAGAVADGSGNEEWCGPEPVRRLLSRFPRLRLVVAHVGAPITTPSWHWPRSTTASGWTRRWSSPIRHIWARPRCTWSGASVRSATGSSSARTSLPSRTGSRSRSGAWPTSGSVMSGCARSSGVTACGSSACNASEPGVTFVDFRVSVW